jgi:hypothetical protein
LENQLTWHFSCRAAFEEPLPLLFQIHNSRLAALGIGQQENARARIEVSHSQPTEFAVPRASQQGCLDERSQVDITGIDQSTRFIVGEISQFGAIGIWEWPDTAPGFHWQTRAMVSCPVQGGF